MPDIASKVLIVGDFVRPFASLESNLLFLRHVLAEPLRLVTGAEPDVNLETVTEEWVNTYDAEPTPRVLEHVARWRDRVVVSFETSPMIWRAYQAAGVMAIDVTVHPLRFLEDLCLGFRATHPGMQLILEDYAVPESTIRASVGLFRARYQREGIKTEGLGGGAVFFGQNDGDRSLIQGGRMTSLRNYRSALDPYRGRLFIRLHPHDHRNDATVVANVLRANVAVDNPYHLLACQADFEVLTVSSGIGAEAKWFGRKVTYFGTPPDCGVPVLHDYTSANFWHRLIGGNDHPHALRFVPNRMRGVLNARWSYPW